MPESASGDVDDRPVPRHPAVYARISLDRNGVSIGVNDQVEQARRWARDRGWPALAVYSDNDTSASDRRRRRARFEQLLLDIASGSVDALVVRHLDRLLRRLDDLERVLKSIEQAPGPVRIILLEGGALDLDTASGRLLARVLTSVAANETEVKVERLVAARARDAQAGRAHQALGYGYNADKTINEEQAAVVRLVAQRILDEGHSWGRVVNDLNADRVPTPWSGKWVGKTLDSLDTDWGRTNHPELHSVISLLRAPRKVGQADVLAALRRAGSSWSREDLSAHPGARDLGDQHVGLSPSQACDLLTAAGLRPPARGWSSANLRTMMARGALCGWRDHAPSQGRAADGLRGRRVGEMVARGEWEPILTKEQVEAIRRSIATGGRQSEAKHLLSGFLVCGRCGKKMVGSFSSDPRVVGRRGGTTWRYSCPRGGNRATPGCGLSVAGEDIDEVVAGWILAALTGGSFRERAVQQSDDPRLPGALARLAEVEAQRDRLMAMYQRKALTFDRWESAMDEVARREREDRSLIDSSLPSRETVEVVSAAPVAPDDLDLWWEAKDLAGRRRVLRALIVGIPLLPSPTGRGRSTPPRDRLGEPRWRV